MNTQNISYQTVKAAFHMIVSWPFAGKFEEIRKPSQN